MRISLDDIGLSCWIQVRGRCVFRISLQNLLFGRGRKRDNLQKHCSY